MSKFQQRHYEAIAEVLQVVGTKAYDAEMSDTALTMVTDAFVHMFKQDNPQFQPHRFIVACEPGANVKARTR